jgi:hypothetical protein
VLLTVLLHMTGDERWLESPYKPKRDVRLIPDPEAGLPREIQDEIRAAALKLFADGEPRPAIIDPGNVQARRDVLANPQKGMARLRRERRTGGEFHARSPKTQHLSEHQECRFKPTFETLNGEIACPIAVNNHYVGKEARRIRYNGSDAPAQHVSIHE